MQVCIVIAFMAMANVTAPVERSNQELCWLKLITAFSLVFAFMLALRNAGNGKQVNDDDCDEGFYPGN